MLTRLLQQRMLLLPLLAVMMMASGGQGMSVTWGQVNKYASALHTQDVYLPRDGGTDVAATLATDTDIVYGLQHADPLEDGYTITAVHAYDMTPEVEHGGDGGTAQLVSGGVGAQHATVRFKRHATVPQLPMVHFQLVIYGISL